MEPVFLGSVTERQKTEACNRLSRPTQPRAIDSLLCPCRLATAASREQTQMPPAFGETRLHSFEIRHDSCGLACSVLEQRSQL